MQRTYAYRGFEVTVEAEDVPAVIVTSKVVSPAGFVVQVSMRHRASQRELPVLRLSDQDEHFFASEADALMAGFSAGQRIIDDILAR